MSLLDELLYEKGKITGAQTHIPAGSVGTTELEDGSVAVGDIADNAVTEAKIAATALGNGLTGGGGTKVAVDVDNASIALVASKVAVKDGGVTGAKLAGAVAGDGIALAVGVLSVDVDGVGVEIATGKVALRDGGVTKARMADAAKRHLISVPLQDFLANNTIYRGILTVPAGKSIEIISAELSAQVIPVDADGVCTVRLVNYDVSDVGAEEIVAAWDAEGLVAQTGTALAVITAGGVNVLEETDYLYVELTNDSVAIDTPWEGAVLTLEYEEL